MRILYLGKASPFATSRHRADALRRVGYDVHLADPYGILYDELRIQILGGLHYRTGFRLLQARYRSWLDHVLCNSIGPDLVWIDGGELFGSGCMKLLKTTGVPIVLYNLDDPTGVRDGRRFDLLRQSLPFYDLCVTVREQTEREMRLLGAKEVLRVWRSYDESAHLPHESRQAIPEYLRSEVAFIGTWMRYEYRDEFVLKLKASGLSVSIWGDRWQKAPNWKLLKGCWRGGALGGRDYAGAIQGAKICLGLLSKGNRDRHTQRSLEVPFAGGLLCGERTDEHLELYNEGKEAVFWADEKECAAACRHLLEDDQRRETIRRQGMARVRSLGVGNEDMVKKVIACLSKVAK